jgi:hypothetical protein
LPLDLCALACFCTPPSAQLRCLLTRPCSTYPELGAYNASTREAPNEEPTHTLAQYYGFASLSLRNMMGAWVRDGLPARLNLSNCEMVAQLFRDPLHPNVLGNVLLADWLLAHLAAAERNLATVLAQAQEAQRTAPHREQPEAGGGKPASPAPEAGLDYGIVNVSDLPEQVKLQHQWRQPDSWRAVPYQDLAWRPQSKPFISKIASSSMRCYILTGGASSPQTGQGKGPQQQSEVQQAAVGAALMLADRPQQLTIKEHSPSWSWTDYQMDGRGEKKHKPGWVGKAVRSRGSEHAPPACTSWAAWLAACPSARLPC